MIGVTPAPERMTRGWRAITLALAVVAGLEPAIYALISGCLEQGQMAGSSQA